MGRSPYCYSVIKIELTTSTFYYFYLVSTLVAGVPNFRAGAERSSVTGWGKCAHTCKDLGASGTSKSRLIRFRKTFNSGTVRHDCAPNYDMMFVIGIVVNFFL